MGQPVGIKSQIICCYLSTRSVPGETARQRRAKMGNMCSPVPKPFASRPDCLPATVSPPHRLLAPPPSEQESLGSLWPGGSVLRDEGERQRQGVEDGNQGGQSGTRETKGMRP